MTTLADLELIEEYMAARSRESFWAYRQYINPGLKIGWWQREVARELMRFYRELIAGERPMLVIQAPPQHGKSVQVVDFISWLAGQNPDIRTIYASFSEDLGKRANGQLQRLYSAPKYQRIFPGTTINTENVVTQAMKSKRNQFLIEYAGHSGYFRNTTIGGQITGQSLDLGVIDDPIKGRKEANSQVVRDAAWNWFTDDFFTRFSEEAGMLAILTRWHVDDPIGRLIDRYPQVRVLSYPAIAMTDEPERKEGEPLFPEHKSLKFLLKRKELMPEANWLALYQQSPVILGGELFKEHWWQYHDYTFDNHPEWDFRIIYADTALKTGQANDYSVFQLWASWKGDLYMLDQMRGKWEAPELIKIGRSFYMKHVDPTNRGPLRGMKIEDKASGTGLIQTLKREGVSVIPIPRSKDKETRAYDVLPAIESGRVYLPRQASWLSGLKEELAAFPNGVHDDQVDPLMDAISDNLVSGYNLSAW